MMSSLSSLSFPKIISGHIGDEPRLTPATAPRRRDRTSVHVASMRWPCVRLEAQADFKSQGCGWSRQTEVIAQSGSRIVPPEQPPSLQLGHDEAHEVLEGAGKICRHDDEAISHPAREPLLELVSDPPGRAGDHPVAAGSGGDIVEIAQRHLLAAGHLQQSPRKGLAALGLLRKLRDRTIERIAGNVVPEPLRD